MANNVALFAVLFLSLLLGFNGSLRTPVVAAQRGYNPKLGLLAGALAGFGGTWIAALLLWAVFSDSAGVFGGLAGGVAGLAALWNLPPDRRDSQTALPEGQDLQRNIMARHLRGRLTRGLFLIAVVFALLSLVTLLWTIVNKTVGYTAVQYAVEPEDLTINGEPTRRALDDLSGEDLTLVLIDGLRVARLRVLILEDVRGAAQEEFAALSQQPIHEVLREYDYPEELADLPFNQIDAAQAARLLQANLSEEDLKQVVLDEIVQLQIVKGWTLWESLTDKAGIKQTVQEKIPQARLKWHSWLKWEFNR
ncbi:MAG: hypothetical protein EHM39_06840, partial [Chloroflexi bacterium]